MEEVYYERQQRSYSAGKMKRGHRFKGREGVHK